MFDYSAGDITRRRCLDGIVSFDQLWVFYLYCKRVERTLLKEHHESVLYVKAIEGKEGFLWKFEDFLKKNPSVLHTGVDKTVKAILAASKRGRVTDYAHYSDVISQLQDVFE